MRPSSVQAELEAEVGRLRDLLEREKLDSVAARNRSGFKPGSSTQFMRRSSRLIRRASFYIGTASQRGFMAGRLRRRLAETSWS